MIEHLHEIVQAHGVVVSASILLIACVKACVRKARVYDTPFAVLLSDCFKKQKLPQTIL